MSRFFDPPRPRLFAHRGASADFPENTLPAFHAAVAAGSRYLELDVWASRDGEVFVHHDRTLQRTGGRRRRLSSLDAKSVRQTDAGWGFTTDGGRTFPFRGQGIGVPLLAEVLNAFPEVFVNVEIKQEVPAIETQVLEVISRTGSAERVLLAAESDLVMSRLRRLCDRIPTSFSRGEVAEFLRWTAGWMGGGYRPAGVALQVPETFGSTRIVSPETLRAAHAIGLEVHVWTVNEPDDMRRLLDMGVDGVMSDRPELLRRTAGGRVSESPR